MNEKNNRLKRAAWILRLLAIVSFGVIGADIAISEISNLR